jgi:transcriptional regulator with XRE-family HTH domain
MRNIELGKVGKKIRQIRKERGLNLQEVSDRSDITPGLLSRIENFRTLPSLPVLHNISMALGVPLSELVETVGLNGSGAPYVLVRSGMIQERSDASGLVYQDILQTVLEGQHLQASLVKLDPGTSQPLHTEESMVLVHAIKGQVQYIIQEDELKLQEGDTLFYNSRAPHRLFNTNEETAVLFKVFLTGKKA